MLFKCVRSFWFFWKSKKDGVQSLNETVSSTPQEGPMTSLSYCPDKIGLYWMLSVRDSREQSWNLACLPVSSGSQFLYPFALVPFFVIIEPGLRKFKVSLYPIK